MSLASTLPGISRFHPAFLVSTWFCSGLLPKAPGTWGSLAALPFAWFIARWGGMAGLLAATGVVSLLGWWASSVYVARTGKDDPKEVVVDEVAGQWLVLAAAPLDPVIYLAGFVIFRILDIWKPWPAGYVDRTIGGGLGIMLDDLLAALYGAALMALLSLWWSLP